MAKKKKTAVNDALTNDAVAAAQMGMTYGQYKAQQYWEAERDKMKQRYEKWKSESDRKAKEAGKEK